MQNIKLSPAYNYSRGLTHKIILTYSDIVAMTSGTAYAIPGTSSTIATAAAQVSASPLVAGTLVKQCYIEVVTAFSGTGTLVAIVGDGGDTARYIASTTLKTAAWIQPTLKEPYQYTAADTIDIVVTAGTDITTFTAGEMHIYLEIFDPAGLRKVRATQ